MQITEQPSAVAQNSPLFFLPVEIISIWGYISHCFYSMCCCSPGIQILLILCRRAILNAPKARLVGHRMLIGFVMGTGAPRAHGGLGYTASHLPWRSGWKDFIQSCPPRVAKPPPWDPAELGFARSALEKTHYVWATGHILNTAGKYINKYIYISVQRSKA